MSEGFPSPDAHCGAARPARHTVIVGGGTAGCVLAARISEDPRHRVTLIEAGPTGETPSELLDGGSIPAAMPGHAANWSYNTEVTPGRSFTVVRGRILGGSSTINGGYFVRARQNDFERWAKAGGQAWSPASVLPILARMEHDIDFGPGPSAPGAETPQSRGHGVTGPVRVQRPALTSDLARAFVAAARELGFPEERDKNAVDQIPGVGPVPTNIIDGIRVNMARAYLASASGQASSEFGSDADPIPLRRSNLQVLGNTRVLRVQIEHGLAVGVETTDGEIRADEVILSAGAVASAQLLLLSGIGPRDQLDEFGIPLVADLPVGCHFSDHPNVPVSWVPTRPLHDVSERNAFPAALNFQSATDAGEDGHRPVGDLEVLLVAKPLGALFAHSTSGKVAVDQHSAAGELQLLVALQAPLGRGRLSLRSRDPMEPPRIEYGHLVHPTDRLRMREGVRTAARILQSQAFAPLFERFASLNAAILADDRLLDAWIRDSLGTAIHLSGTAPMGEVVAGDGRVLGVSGLRVADTSVLPTVPSRGPFNTAVLIGELIADRIRADLRSP